MLQYPLAFDVAQKLYRHGHRRLLGNAGLSEAIAEEVDFWLRFIDRHHDCCLGAGPGQIDLGAVAYCSKIARKA